MNKFDTAIQEIKYQVIKELIRRADKQDFADIYIDIPKMISPGPKASLRCCIYKERAIVQDRIKLAMGGDGSNPNVIEVIDSACDECPLDGIKVTSSCRGCITHMCKESCPRDAITIVNHHAVIDKSKCIECGRCKDACPYSAIVQAKRPCVKSCKVGAISMDENKKAVIDNDKCVACGACVYKCPFGAIGDKSFILDILDILRQSADNTAYKVYAVIAPSIVSQFKYAKIEQVVTGLHKLGFYQVVEAALGADITLYKEAIEFKEKGTLTTSCCPSFVMYIQKHFPELEKYISHSVSPMVEAALLIKHDNPDAKVIFIGPCTSKKMEFRQDKIKGIIDNVMSFEELQAFFDAREIDIASLPDTPLDNASYYGRIFAKSGGIAEGITKVAADMGAENVRPVSMNGLEECKINLLKLKAGKSDFNFFEGMACEGGCINGALCLHHGPKNAADVNRYGAEAKEKTIDNSVKLYKMTEERN